MVEEVYNFSGKHTDRAELSVTFDGLKLIISVEDQNKSEQYLSVVFDKTFNYEFESVASMEDYPSACAEKLIKEPASEFLRKRHERFSSFFTDETEKFTVYFEDYGLFTIFAERAEIVEGKMV